MFTEVRNRLFQFTRAVFRRLYTGVRIYMSALVSAHLGAYGCAFVRVSASARGCVHASSCRRAGIVSRRSVVLALILCRVCLFEESLELVWLGRRLPLKIIDNFDLTSFSVLTVRHFKRRNRPSLLCFGGSCVDNACSFRSLNLRKQRRRGRRLC